MSVERAQKLTSCPYLHSCEVPITKNFFGRICNIRFHVNCHHYAKRTETLKTPMAWLQKQAIELDAKQKPGKVNVKRLHSREKRVRDLMRRK